jgi:drug/metabolite transporter (DMT)-like permease
MIEPPANFRELDKRRSAIIGTACCIASALGYATVNCLKRFLTMQCDRPMVLAVQDSVSVVLVGAWLIWRSERMKDEGSRMKARFILHPSSFILSLLFVGLASQFLGNLPVLWAMSVVGLAVTITTVLGMGLLGAAIFGQVFLGERVSLQSAGAMTLLAAAIVFISFGASGANQSPTRAAEVSGPLWIAVAVAAACLAGLVYAGLGVVVRRLLIGGTPHALILFIVPAVGVATLGPLSLARQGLSAALATPGRDISIMLLAGVLNLLAYLATLHGLKLMSLLRNNVLLASQVAMAAVAGFIFFGEPPHMGVVLGVVLTIAGIILLG